MPGIAVGHCQVVSDAGGRVYVIWRAGLAVNFQATLDPYGGGPSNLFYRVLDNGKWSKILPINAPADANTQDEGTLSYYAAPDAAGHIQIVWNTNPDKWHPELTATSGTYHQHISGIGTGLVFQSTLDGTAPSAPREVYLSPVTDKDPKNQYTGACDGLDTLNGYFDSTGAMHMIAHVTSYNHPISGKYRYQVLESGKPGQFVDLPELSYHAWRDIPTLLVDAKGQRHVVTLYPYGEHPDVRDYILGSDEDPTIIRATTGPKATLDGFQAYQGPGGKMVALMQMNDSGERGEGDDFLSVSTGDGKWSTPINITNNHGRATFASKQHGASGVAISTNYYPGPGAVTFAPDGHLLLVMINNEHSLFGSSAFGVEIAGGSSSTPTLRFLRF